VLCLALEVSESGYYGWKNREASVHYREDARLAAEIQQLYLDHRKLYGSPRIHAALQARGIRTSRKRVLRLMQQLGIGAQVKRSSKPTTRSDPSAHFAPNTLNRDVMAALPNTKWVTDTKAVETAEGWLHVAVILDLFSRLVVGWAMAATGDSALTDLALRMAVARRHPGSDLLHHSDRGTEFTSDRYQAALRELGIELTSRSRTGNCWDNAAMESFFATLADEVWAMGRILSWNDAQEAKSKGAVRVKQPGEPLISKRSSRCATRGGRGMNILLVKIVLWSASNLPHEAFMLASFPKLYKVRLRKKHRDQVGIFRSAAPLFVDAPAVFRSAAYG
jgi:putative transposase